jgi:hypothetical protein
MRVDIFDLRSAARAADWANLRLEPEAEWSIGCSDRRRVAAVGDIIRQATITAPRGGRRQGRGLVS